MITLKNLVTNQEHVVKPTIFPDGTSQVWQLPEELLVGKEFQILWNFEAEREIVDILSLTFLLQAPLDRPSVHLVVPYLPYARQDKDISNKSTFNLSVFMSILRLGRFISITTEDVHNPKFFKELNIFGDFFNIMPDNHKQVAASDKYDYIVFPDKGAYERYKDQFPGAQCIIVNKKRDQLTSELKGFSFSFANLDWENVKSWIDDGMKFLLVDDLCDAGGTFIGISERLHKINPNITVHLSVTHGLFTKGLDVLRNAGISKIFSKGKEV